MTITDRRTTPNLGQPLPLAEAAPPACSFVRTYSLDTVTVVELRGTLDLATASHVRAHLDAAAAPQGARVVVDMRPVEFFDCTTLGLLCRTRRRARASDGLLVVVCARPWHLRIHTAAGLHRLLRPVATLEAALTQASQWQRPTTPRPSALSQDW
ncbi:STAS domain-containing protein [Streptomyces sp. NPDC057302]|uniref:STAS domain-containing protein n=1 Tax=Streptomyces sp. NPDC057302 TaxID=3346094 RepID=UPI003634068D